MKALTGTLWPGTRISRKRKGNSISSEVMVQVTITPLVESRVKAASSLTSVDIKEFIRSERICQDLRLRLLMTFLGAYFPLASWF